ncbi:formimidoylglutamate deiminase [Caenispirillum bisanense]|uniref:formimidoylglutamate deiminase n=1 Tax=Caenispirillum bisanense TaxID=414052 RepID=UPI0031D68A42
MRKLFFRRALLPQGWAEAVAVTVDDTGRITEVESNAQPSPEAETVAGIALPGLANLHSHAHQRAIAGLGERSGSGGDSFWSWREAMYRAVARLDPEDFEAVATQLYVEMLKAGYTAVAEFHYLHHAPDGRPYADPAEMAHRVAAAAQAAGMPLTLLPVHYAASGFGGLPPTEGQRRFIHDLDGFLRLTESLRAAYAGRDDVVVGIAPHSLRAVPGQELQALAAATPDGPIHIHIAEQTREVDDCLSHTGRRPVGWLLENLPVDGRWCLIHATHVTAEEVAGMARAGCVVGLCPTTEANLGDGLFPAEDYFAAGGAFGIGSDSHISVSPVEELRWLEYGARLTHRRRTVLAGGPDRSTGRTLFETAAAGGARACGFATGALAVGRRADVVVLDDAHPLLAGRSGDAVLDSWIFAGNAALVRHVYIAGRAVVRDGRHPLEDQAARRFTPVLERLFA